MRNCLSKADLKMLPMESCGVWWVYQPIRCGYGTCTKFATSLDPFAPYHYEMSRCTEHVGKLAPTKKGP